MVDRRTEKMILKITLTYILMLAVAGILYALVREHLFVKTQVKIERVLAVMVALLAVWAVILILRMIWVWI